MYFSLSTILNAFTSNRVFWHGGIGTFTELKNLSPLQSCWNVEINESVKQQSDDNNYFQSGLLKAGNDK